MLEPEIKLDKIWRQAADSPIIAISTMARSGQVIPIKAYGEGVEKLDRNDPTTGDAVQAILESHDSDTLVLCGYNSTRQKLNNHVRELKGFEGPDPQRNDTIVCLRNNRESGLSNGQIGVITSISATKNDNDLLW